jgi:DNA (cytosine-5)-methyltransferase 1
MTATVTDLFCGAGGSSLGAELAGARLKMAANHWTKAIEVHQTNFEHADHDCADISQVDPRRYPRTDILLASPECTNHSSAKGVSRQTQHPSLFEGPDPGAERSRATMWDVHRFVEVHRYDAVIVENVVDAARWIYWPSWWQAWDDAGYDARVLSINSAHTGEVPQWRDRIYVVATRRGLPAVDIELRPRSWCPTCEQVVEGVQSWRRARTVGKWRQQYDYRCGTCAGLVGPPAPPAASIIDWSLRGVRIGDRPRPLAAKTLARIERALAMYGTALVAAAGNTWERPGYTRAWPIDQPVPTQAATAQHALIVPVHHGARGPQARPSWLPHPTQTGRQEHAVVVPLRNHTRPTLDEQPLPTVTAGGQHHGLLFAPQSGGEGRPTAMPVLVSYNRTGEARPVTEPASAVTTRDRHAVVAPAFTVEDCLFRMLEPHEAGRAMAFPDDYRVEGTKRDRVKLYGNAVTPPVMRVLLGRVLDALSEGAA